VSSATKVVKRILAGLLIGPSAIILLLIFAYKYLPDRWLFNDEFKVSERIIEEAENFRKAHNRVPEEKELNALLQKYGIELSEKCPCYQTVTDANYQVWFVYKSVGNSMIYSSEGKTWYEGG
jgi:hypothetical protein